MINTEIKLRNLQKEARALKATFEQAAGKLPLITKTLSFSTSRNAVTENGFTYDDLERAVVTLATASGANTLAKLEVSGNYDTLPVVRRIPFSGGARWIVTTNARIDSSYNWTPTTYQFAVQTLANGTLTAKMIWE